VVGELLFLESSRDVTLVASRSLVALVASRSLVAPVASGSLVALVASRSLVAAWPLGTGGALFALVSYGPLITTLSFVASKPLFSDRSESGPMWKRHEMGHQLPYRLDTTHVRAAVRENHCAHPYQAIQSGADCTERRGLHQCEWLAQIPIQTHARRRFDGTRS
jgi:hypothetical protein